MRILLLATATIALASAALPASAGWSGQQNHKSWKGGHQGGYGHQRSFSHQGGYGYQHRNFQRHDYGYRTDRGAYRYSYGYNDGRSYRPTYDYGYRPSTGYGYGTNGGTVIIIQPPVETAGEKDKAPALGGIVPGNPPPTALTTGIPAPIGIPAPTGTAGKAPGKAAVVGTGAVVTGVLIGAKPPIAAPTVGKAPPAPVVGLPTTVPTPEAVKAPVAEAEVEDLDEAETCPAPEAQASTAPAGAPPAVAATAGKGPEAAKACP